MGGSDLAVSLDDVSAAARRLAGVAHRTPLLRSTTLDEATGAQVVLKAECFQRSGTFKLRGAYNRIAALSPRQRAAGVVAYSSGNHAQAVALAGALLDTPATVVVPTDAPRVKVAATRSYGARLVTYDPATEDRVEVATALAATQGATVVPPFDDPRVIAGQGTVGLELCEDGGDLDLLVVPVGGGGLIAGCATAAKGLGRAGRVVGVEPEDGDDTRRSLAAGAPVTVPPPRTIADGLRVRTPGRLTFPVVARLVDEVVAVADDDIARATVWCLERLKVVVEPSGAAGLAAVLSGRLEVAGARVGVVLSGGNLDLGVVGTLTGPR